MKKQALIITILAITILLAETDLSSDLLFFLLVGAIPGTSYSLSSNTMLTLITIASGLVLFRQPFVWSIFQYSVRTVGRHLNDTKERLLKRPLGQI